MGMNCVPKPRPTIATFSSPAFIDRPRAQILVGPPASWLARQSPTRQLLGELLFHLQRAAIECRDHRLHVTVLGDIGVRALIRFSQERRRRHPLRRDRAPDGRAGFLVEMNSLEAAVLRVFAESREEIPDRRATLYDGPARQIYL